MKRLWRWILIALLALVAAGLAAPRVSADRFRPRIQAALEAALGRPVQLGAVHLNLFTGPGFTVDDVMIDDVPAAGIEPFAHVEHMQARIRWLSVFSGNLDFSSLRLDAPSVNIVKIPSGPWNIQPLLDRTTWSSASPRRGVPDIEIRGGRIDFKFGDTKSVFYISDADVDVYPNENGELVIRFSGAPARTDQAAQSFGELTARGLLRPGLNGESQLSMGLHLDRTPVSEVARLFHGSDIGVHGYVLADAKLAGAISKVEITGSVNISDVHRWDLMPAPGEGWTLNYRGKLNLTGHHLEVASLATPGQADPISVDFHLDDYLAAPRWSTGVQFHDLPAASLVETARHFGAPLPSGVDVQGKVEGEIGYSSQSGAGGELTLAGVAVKFPQAGSSQTASVQLDSAQLELSNRKVVLAPANVDVEDGQSAQIEGEYAFDKSHAAFRISTRQLAIGSAHVLDGAPVPLIEQLRQGSWKGWISYEKNGEDPGAWAGQYDLLNVAIAVPGLAAPVRLASATVQMNDGLQVTRMRGRAGTIKFEGDYRYDPKAAHPDRLRLTIPELELAGLESQMLPTLRRTEGFLARTFRRSQPLPKWLEDRDADISVKVVSLLNGDANLGGVTAHAVWRGALITVPNIDWELDDMHASGKIAVNLTKPEPRYNLTGTVENFDYRNGQLDLDGELNTSGIGADLLVNLRSNGTFEGRGIMLAPDAEVREVSGTYRVAPSYGVPRLALSNVQVVQGADTLVGQGTSQADGHIVLELTSGRRQVRLTGMLLPVHPEPAAVR